jgi:uncharacterized protein YndB with AHSA1/START domain
MTRAIEVQVEVQIARAPEDVWAFVSDPERLPEWLGEFREVVKQSEGPIGKGTVLRYTIDPGERSGTMQFVEWQPGRRLAWDGPPLQWQGGAARPHGFFEVTDAGEGHSRLVCCFQPVLTGSMALLAPVMKRWLRKQRTSDTARLKTLLRVLAREAPQGSHAGENDGRLDLRPLTALHLSDGLAEADGGLRSVRWACLGHPGASSAAASRRDRGEGCGVV